MKQHPDAKLLTTKRFRADLLSRLKNLADKSRPRATVTAHMEAAFEEYLDRHEPKKKMK
jgi:predicted transcriptional regulator